MKKMNINNEIEKRAIIRFKCMKMSGGAVGEMTMDVGPFEEDASLYNDFLPLQRMCLEYARVNRVSCSFVKIEQIDVYEIFKTVQR